MLPQRRRGASPGAAEATCRAHARCRQAIRVGVMARRGSAPQGARRGDAVTPEQDEPGRKGRRRAEGERATGTCRFASLARRLSDRRLHHRDRPLGTNRAARPYRTGRPRRNRHPTMSSTSRCNGSLLPSPGRAGYAPLPLPAVIVPPPNTLGILSNRGLLAAGPVG